MSDTQPKNDEVESNKSRKWQQVDIVKQRYYTTNEIMTQLNFSRHTIYEYAEKKLIPNAIKIGGHWRFPVHDFEKWLVHTHTQYRNGQFQRKSV